MGGSAFDQPHDLRDGQGWEDTDKQMDMVCLALHCKDLNTMFLTGFPCMFLKRRFQSRNVEDLPLVSGAEHKVVMDQ